MEAIIREYFLLMKQTEELAQAIGAGDDREILRQLARRGARLETIRTLERLHPHSPATARRVAGIMSEVVALEKKNNMEMQNLMRTMQQRIHDLREARRQLVRIGNGYAHAARPRPRVVDQVF